MHLREKARDVRRERGARLNGQLVFRNLRGQGANLVFAVPKLDLAAAPDVHLEVDPLVQRRNLVVPFHQHQTRVVPARRLVRKPRRQRDPFPAALARHGVKTFNLVRLLVDPIAALPQHHGPLVDVLPQHVPRGHRAGELRVRVHQLDLLVAGFRSEDVDLVGEHPELLAHL